MDVLNTIVTHVPSSLCFDLPSFSLDVEDELTDMDEVLGPKNDDAESSSSGGSSPRSSLSPEEVTHYTVKDDYVVSSASVQANSDPSTPADSPLPVNKNTHKEVKENGYDATVADNNEEREEEEEEAHSKQEEKEEAHSKQEEKEEAHSKQEEKEEEAHSKQEQKEEAHSKDEEPQSKEQEVAPSKEEEKEEDVVHSKEVIVPASQSPELVIKVTDSNNKTLSSSDDDSEGEEAPPTPSDTTSTSTEGDRQPDSANSEPTSPATNGHEKELRASPDIDARRPSGECPSVPHYLKITSTSLHRYQIIR